MNNDLILSFTIVLSFIGICVSITALIFSVIYLLRLSAIAKTQSAIAKTQMDIKKSFKIIADIKAILIAQCCLYSDNGMIKGKDAIKLIMDREGLDEINAIKYCYNHDMDKNK